MESNNDPPASFSKSMMDALEKIVPQPGVIFKERNGVMIAKPLMRSRAGLHKALGAKGVWIHLPIRGAQPLIVHGTNSSDAELGSMLMKIGHLLGGELNAATTTPP